MLGLKSLQRLDLTDDSKKWIAIQSVLEWAEMVCNEEKGVMILENKVRDYNVHDLDLYALGDLLSDLGVLIELEDVANDRSCVNKCIGAIHIKVNHWCIELVKTMDKKYFKLVCHTLFPNELDHVGVCYNFGLISDKGLWYRFLDSDIDITSELESFKYNVIEFTRRSKNEI